MKLPHVSYLSQYLSQFLVITALHNSSILYGSGLEMPLLVLSYQSLEKYLHSGLIGVFVDFV